MKNKIKKQAGQMKLNAPLARLFSQKDLQGNFILH